jgi:RHS repeat-associated protein
MVDGVGVTRYTYTSVSQILSEVGPWSSDTVTYGYSDMLRTSLSLQQPTGSWTNGYAYDAAKRLTNVTSQAGAFGYSYDPTRQMLPEAIALPNTSYISNVYDVNARLLTTTLYNSAGGTLDAAQYGYNVGNQRTAYTNAAGTDVAYIYDAIGQLKVANSTVSSENRGYAYDAAWNLNDRTNNGVNTTFGVNSLNEQTSEGTTSFYLDANGNLTNRTPVSGFAITNFFDAENRLVGVTTTSNAGVAHIPIETTFVYDGLGRLREQLWWTNSAGSGGGGGGGSSPPPTGGGSNEWFLVGGIGYIYDGNRVIQERDLNNNPLVSYTRGRDLSGTLGRAGGIGGLLARSDGYSSGLFSDHNFYHADGNGNITYLVNGSQTLAASYRYDPFGNLLNSNGSLAASNTYRFSSKEFIPSVGLCSYLYRFYDPGLQRWLNRDPIGERGGLNLYGFVRNNSINEVDPFGLCAPAVPVKNYHPTNGPWNKADTTAVVVLSAVPVVASIVADYLVTTIITTIGVAEVDPNLPTQIQNLTQEGQQVLQQEEAINNALNNAARDALSAMNQVDAAQNAAQYDAAQEQAAAADQAYQEALKNWQDFQNNLGH